MIAASPTDRLIWERADVQGRPAAFGAAGDGPPGLPARLGAGRPRLQAGAVPADPARPARARAGPARLRRHGRPAAGRLVARRLRGLRRRLPRPRRRCPPASSSATPSAAGSRSRPPTTGRARSRNSRELDRRLGVDRGARRRATHGRPPALGLGVHLPADLWPRRQARRVLPVIVEDALPNLLRSPSALLRVGRLAAHANLAAELEELKRRGQPVVVLWGRSDKEVTSACLDSVRTALGDEAVVRCRAATPGCSRIPMLLPGVAKRRLGGAGRDRHARRGSCTRPGAAPVYLYPVSEAPWARPCPGRFLDRCQRARSSTRA